MNDARRKEIANAITLLEGAKDLLEKCRDDEQEAFDNMSEGLQSSDRGQAIEANATSLGEAYDQVEEAINSLESIDNA